MSSILLFWVLIFFFDCLHFLIFELVFWIWNFTCSFCAIESYYSSFTCYICFHDSTGFYFSFMQLIRTRFDFGVCLRNPEASSDLVSVLAELWLTMILVRMLLLSRWGFVPCDLHDQLLSAYNMYLLNTKVNHI